MFFFSLKNIFLFWRYPDFEVLALKSGYLQNKKIFWSEKKTYVIVPEGLPLMLKKQNSKNILT